ncbi:MAG: hypothetical protein AAB380_00415 [Verrucomicrobiota bacterium]
MQTGGACLIPTLADARPAEWRELVGSVRVPDGVSELALQLYASGQIEESDVAWFDEVRLAKFAP